MRISVCGFVALWSMGSATAAELPRIEAVPGGVALVGIAPASAAAPRVYFEAERVLVVNHDGHWKAVVGLPLSLAAGEHELRVQQDGAPPQRLFFRVQDKTYPAQHLQVANRRHVNPAPEDLKRIEQDRLVLQRAFSTWSEDLRPPFDFTLPAPGRFSAAFGLRRYFNGQARAPHSGVDIAAPRGTPIRAPAPGRVIEVGNYFFNGNTVFLDHGHGLISMFNHLDEIGVTRGQRLARGEPLGTIGATGRVTGPHLHWTVSLNNARVDPLLFVPDLRVSPVDTAPAVGKNP